MLVKQHLKWLISRTLYGIGITILSGLVLAFVLSFIPVNTGFAQAQNEHVEIFITSNGIHTDLILPVATPYIDWRSKIARC